MFSKICSSLKLLNALKGFLLKRISSPVQSARIANYGFGYKKHS